MTRLTLRIAYAVLCVTALALLLNAARLTVRSWGPASLDAAGRTAAGIKPYTLILSETLVGASGQRRAGPLSMFALRSDGATVLRLGTTEEAARILNFPSGFEVKTNEQIRARSTMPIKMAAQTGLRDPDSSCISNTLGHPATTLGEHVLGMEDISGLRTVRVGTDAKYGLTFWFALDHSCAKVRIRTGYGEGGFSEQHVVELTPAEPSAALFDVEGYAEVPPSVLGPYRTAGNVALKKRLDKLDRLYYDRRAGLGLLARPESSSRRPASAR